MRRNRDKTKALLEELVNRLFAEEQTVRPASPGDAYLMGADGRYLGKITHDSSDPDALTNPYGRHGSRYSPYSIFNPTSPMEARRGNSASTTPTPPPHPSCICRGNRQDGSQPTRNCPTPSTLRYSSTGWRPLIHKTANPHINESANQLIC